MQATTPLHELQRAEARLLEYVESARLDYVRFGPRRPQTLPELARRLQLEVQACAQALHDLTGRGQIQAMIHPGARFELRPSRTGNAAGV